MKQHGSSLILFILVICLPGCFYNISLLPETKPLQESVVGGSGVDKIVLINVSGFISEQKPSGLIDKPDMVARIKEELNRAAQDKDVKGILLKINSPGGTVTASDLIYNEILQFKKKTGKTVTASILDLGTSGAYYIAMAADQVLVHPTSVIGSIGVIMLHVNVEGLMKKVGVGAESIKSGVNKDLGSPLKPLSPEGRGILQVIIDNMHARFLKVIEAGREGLSPQRIQDLADGRVYTAAEAKASGLVDDIAYLDQAIDITKAKAGIQKARLVIYARGGEYKNNIYSQALQPSADPLTQWGIDPKTLLRGGSPRFLYLWSP
ncbi:MAG: signal peptide peptidase SppA [Nitrospiria bacterium]